MEKKDSSLKTLAKPADKKPVTASSAAGSKFSTVKQTVATTKKPADKSKDKDSDFDDDVSSDYEQDDDFEDSGDDPSVSATNSLDTSLKSKGLKVNLKKEADTSAAKKPSDGSLATKVEIKKPIITTTVVKPTGK